jgi:hypothetical protein
MRFLINRLLIPAAGILLIIPVSCQEKHSKMEWKYIDFNKLPSERDNQSFDAFTKYRFNQILNYNKDTFFLLGDNNKEVPSGSPDAVVYGTKDFGDTWKKTVLGKGTVQEGIFAGNTLFAAVHDRNFEENKLSSTLFTSTDFGDTWKEIKTFNGEMIYSINFYSPKTGIAVFGKNTGDGWTEEYRYTQDGGKTWVKFNPEIKDFDTRYNCVFRSESLLLSISADQLFEYDLQTGEKKILKKLPVPKGITAGCITKDEKTGELQAVFTNKEDMDKNRGLYYIDTDEYIPLPDGYYVDTWGDYFYGLLFDRPFSTYVWSTDRGKTWNKELLDYQMIFTSMPKGYYGEGYIYIEAFPFKREKDERNTYLAIGHPVNN